MSRLELARPRDISALFADALGVYFRNAGTFLALSAAVVVPVHLIVEGVGMEELTAATTPRPPPVEAAIPTLVSFLVVAPLINAICIHALHDGGRRAAPAGAPSILAGLESFAPIFFAVVLAGLGIALGLVLLVLPGHLRRGALVLRSPDRGDRGSPRHPRRSPAPPSWCAARGGGPSA